MAAQQPLSDTVQQLICILDQVSDPSASVQSHVTAYLESLNASSNGWRLCVEAIARGDLFAKPQVLFYCLQTIEKYFRVKFIEEYHQYLHLVKDFLNIWIHKYCVGETSLLPAYVRNKAAQVWAVLGVVVYPDTWPSYVLDLVSLTASRSANVVDMYLRVLQQFDIEVCNREYLSEEMARKRSMHIKDSMRDTCLSPLVDSWLHIILHYTRPASTHLVVMCLDVISRYIAWIDINLVMNDRFFTALSQLLTSEHLRDATVDCFHDIVHKGMSPVGKLHLVRVVFSALVERDTFSVIERLHADSSTEDVEFSVRLSRLFSALGCQLVDAYRKCCKQTDSPGSLPQLEECINTKLAHALLILAAEYDEVSEQVVEFLREYIQLLKARTKRTENDLSVLGQICYILLNKYKYDSIETEFDSSSETDAIFQQYRKNLKTLYDNLIGVESEYIAGITRNLICSVLDNWRNCNVADIEASISLLFILGDSLSLSMGKSFSQIFEKWHVLRELMHKLVLSDVIKHQHRVISFQYFEVVARYDRFFILESDLLPTILHAFFSDKGMRHSCISNSSRAVYLFSRFVRSLQSHLQPYTRDILDQLHSVLYCADGSSADKSRIVEDNHLYLYEAMSVLIVSSPNHYGDKHKHLSILLDPVMDEYNRCMCELSQTCNGTISAMSALAEQPPSAEGDVRRRTWLETRARHAVLLVARTTKAFSAHVTMKRTQTVQLYLSNFSQFVNCLKRTNTHYMVQSALIQFLHRLLVCIDVQAVHAFVEASDVILTSADSKRAQEYVTLFLQATSKFKSDPVFQSVVLSMLSRLFPVISDLLLNTTECNSISNQDNYTRSEISDFHSSYLSLLAALISNGLADVIAAQTERLVRYVLCSLTEIASFSEPPVQRNSFRVLRHLIDVWFLPGGGVARDSAVTPPVQWFTEFVTDVVSVACVRTPLAPSFDFADAQAALVFTEMVNCLYDIYRRMNDQFLVHMQTKILPQFVEFSHTSNLATNFCHIFLISEFQQFRQSMQTFYQDYAKKYDRL